MRDLFSGCAYVRTCQSHLRMSICRIWGHAWNVNLRSYSGAWALLIHVLHKDIRRCFLVMEDREDSVAWPLQCTYLVKLSAERSRLLATLTKRKQKSQSTIKVKRVQEEDKSSKEESMYNNSFVLFFGLPLKPAAHNFWHHICIDTFAIGTLQSIIHMHTPSLSKYSCFVTRLCVCMVFMYSIQGTWSYYGCRITLNYDIFQIIPLFSHRSDEIVTEVLAFLKAILFAGNHHVQEGMIHLLDTREERIFTMMQGLLTHAAIAHRERWVKSKVQAVNMMNCMPAPQHKWTPIL